MINTKKWIGTLPNPKTNMDHTSDQISEDKWINTINRKKDYYSVKKYSSLGILLVCGLLFVSVIKNESRNLQKEINHLEASIDKIKYNLNQAILDNEIITSPKNISRLAKEHLENDLKFYDKSQIKKFSDKEKMDEDFFYKPSVTIKAQIEKRIEKKKAEIKKLKEIYSDPQSIPSEIRIQVAKQINEKKTELKSIYYSPKETFNIARVGKWSAIQVVKALLGMPIIPGR